MKTKIKNLTAVLFTLVITLAAVLLIAYAGSARESRGESAQKVRALSENTEQIVIASDSGSDFTLIYSSDSLQKDQTLANSLASAARELFGTRIWSHVLPDSAVTEEAELEILIGNTDRSQSAAFHSELLAKLNSEADLIWGYAYIDGKLLFTANSPAAFTVGGEDFLNYLAENDYTVPSDLYVFGYMTAAEYEEYLKMLEEEQREQRLAELKEMNEAFASNEKLTTGYTPMIAEGASSPYAKPWAYPAEDQHPRFLITEDNVNRIKEMMNDPEYSAIFENLQTLAKMDINNGILPQKGSDVYDETILSAISARAMMYLLTGDELYAYEAIVSIKNALLTVWWDPATNLDSYHGASNTMMILCAVYDWCYPVLTESDKWQLITGTVTTLWPQTELDYPPTNYNALTGHGVGPQFIRNCVSLATVFYDEAPDWWEFILGRYFEEYLPVANEAFKSGWVSQGTSTYGNSRLKNYTLGAYVIKIATGENFFTEDAAFGAQFLISHIMPNGRYFETGDGTRKANGGEMVFASYFTTAALFNEPVALAWAKYLSNDYKNLSIDLGQNITPEFILCFLSSVTADSVDKADIGLVQYFGNPAGTMTVRDSWDEDAIAVIMKIGNMSLSGHDIYDHGTFQIYYKGLLAGTSGSYKVYGGTSHFYYLKSTVAHNGLLIFNPSKASENKSDTAAYYYSGSQRILASPSTIEQWQNGDYMMAETTGASWAYKSNGSAKYAYIAGDITQAYPDDTVDYVGRRMFTLYTGNTDIPMVFLVFDEITSDSEAYEKTFLLHTITEPTVDTESISATVINGDGRLVLESLYGAKVIEKIGGEGYAYWINGYYKEDGTYVEGKNCLDSATTSDNYDKIWGRIQLRASGEKTTNFLTAMYVTDADSTAKLEINKYQNDYVYGATFGSDIVMFCIGSEKAYKSFSFETDGRGLCNYYISGIADGTWNVSVDGVTVAHALSSDESGMITFIAPAGNVELTPGADVIGSNGGRIRYSTGGGIFDGDYPIIYMSETATPLPMNISKNNEIFCGWYTSSNFDPKTYVTEIPAGTTGTFQVYAKWLSNLLTIDYSDTKLNNVKKLTSGSSTVNVATYNTNNGSGVLFETKTDEDGSYLDWIKGGKSSFFTVANKVTNYSTLKDDNECVSFTVTFSKNGDAPIPETQFRVYSREDTNGNSLIARQHIFTTNSEGEIRLGNSDNGPIAGYVTEYRTTLRIVLDFKNEELRAYDAYGNVCAKTSATVSGLTNNPGVSTMSEWRKLLTSVIMYWVSVGGENSSGLKVYNIKIDDGDRFKDLKPEDGMIVYDLNDGGVISHEAPLYYSTEAPTVLPTPLAFEGKAFCGWYTSSDFSEGTEITAVPADTDGIVYVYAKWVELSLNYVTNGGTLPEGAPSIYSKETPTVLPTPTRAGYYFDGWYTSSDFNEETKLSEIPTETVGAMTVYAKWTESNVYYDIVYNENGGTLPEGAPTSFKASVTTTLPIPTKEGYTFDGWYTTEDFETGTCISKIAAGITETVTLYAKWSKIIVYYDIVYNLNGGILPGNAPYVYDTDADTALPAAYMEGYAFAGWYTTETFDEGSEISMIMAGTEEAVTLYAKWGEKLADAYYGITYNLNGGTLPEGAPETYNTAVHTALPEPAKDGYAFAGWYPTEDCIAGERIRMIYSGITGEVTLYAKWARLIIAEDYTGEKVSISDGKYADTNAAADGSDSFVIRHNLTTMTGYSMTTDGEGNKYLKVSVSTGATGNGQFFSRDPDNNLPLTDITSSDTISFEISFSALKGVAIPRLLLATRKPDLGLIEVEAGTGDIYLVKNADAAKDSVCLGTVSAGSFIKIRICLDFANNTLTAYDEAGKVIRSISRTIDKSAIDRSVINTFIYGAKATQDMAILIDDIRVIDGNIYAN